MPLTEKERLLAISDDAWSHKWESIHSATQGLMQEEAQYQHSSHFADAKIDEEPFAGTILWQLMPLDSCCRYYAEVLAREFLLIVAHNKKPGVTAGRSDQYLINH